MLYDACYAVDAVVQYGEPFQRCESVLETDEGRPCYILLSLPCAVPSLPSGGVSISNFSDFIHKILYSTQQPSAGSLEFAVVLTRHVSNI